MYALDVKAWPYPNNFKRIGTTMIESDALNGVRTQHYKEARIINLAKNKTEHLFTRTGNNNVLHMKGNDNAAT